MNAILCDCPTTTAHIEEFVEQIRVATFATPSAQPALSNLESRQALRSQLESLDVELRDHCGDLAADGLESLRDELVSYVERMSVQLEAREASSDLAALVEGELCEFAELLYDYDRAADALRNTAFEVR